MEGKAYQGERLQQSYYDAVSLGPAIFFIYFYKP